MTLAAGPVGLLAAIPAAVYVNSAIRHVGRGIQEAANSVSADTTLRLAYEHEGMQPGHRIHKAVALGRMVHDHPLPLTF